MARDLLIVGVVKQKGNDAMKKTDKNRKVASRESAVAKEIRESDEARGIRESIEEMERELAELDRDIAEARKGDKGEMSQIAHANFRAMRKDIVEMIASSKELYKTVLESEKLEAKLKDGE